MKVCVVEIGFGILFSVELPIDLENISLTLKKISNFSESLKALTANKDIESTFNITQESNRLPLEKPRPFIACFNLRVYQKSPKMIIPKYTSKEEVEAHQIFCEEEREAAIAIVSEITMKMIKSVGFPDFFIKYPWGNIHILQRIYPEIQEMGKEIDYTDYSVNNIGTTSWPLQKTWSKAQ